MENGYHNTYVISDSDNDSDIVIKDHPSNVTPTEDSLLSSPDEPSFFRQIVQRKRKKSSSPVINLFTDQCIVLKDNTKENDCIIIDDHEPNICNSKSSSPEKYLLTDQCILSKDVSIEEKLNECIEINDREPNICKPTEPKRKKRLTKEEIEEKKKEEKAQKDAKKKLVEELKRLNPKECLKYITVHIDINLQNRDYSEQIFNEIQSTDAKYTVESNSYAPYSVTWSRQKSNTVSEDENMMLIIWDFEQVKDLISSNQLVEKISDLKLYKAKISLIIYITADQIKKAKAKKKNQLPWSDLLDSLSKMMLGCCISFRFVENINDVGLAVFNFTKSIAQKPHKLNKYREEQAGCDWYASGHTKNCVSIDKNGNGLSQLWRQMLLQFPLCGLETSEAIASVYGSPVILLEAYDKCSSRSAGESLLQDIPVRRGFGPLASNRRVGPELSKKIYTFFTDNTGCTTLSQE